MINFPTHETVVSLDISRIVESANNPRKVFDEAGMTELVDSIRSQGLLQPIVVRELPKSLMQWEVVFGHRRLRACTTAGLDTVPAIIRALTDEQADQARLHENLERQDVHYIEEAEALHRLVTDHGLSAETLVEQTGKKKTYIYGRLKMAGLDPVVRARCMDGTIGAEVATLIARLPQPLHQDALDAVTYTDFGQEGHPVVCRAFRDARVQLRNRMTITIESAPFETLGCESCRRLSHNDPALEDLGANICTDRTCYDSKRAEAHQLRAEAAKADGTLVPPDAPLDAFFLPTKFVRNPANDWVDLSDLLAEATLSGIALPQRLTRVTADGSSHHVYRRTDVEKLQAAMGVAPLEKAMNNFSSHNSCPELDEAELEAIKPAARAVRLHWPHLRSVALSRLAERPLSAEHLRYVLLDELDMSGTFEPEICAAVGWPECKDADNVPQSAQQAALINGMDGSQLGVLLVALHLACERTNYGRERHNADGRTAEDQRLIQLLKVLGVDPVADSPAEAVEPAEDLFSGPSSGTPQGDEPDAQAAPAGSWGGGAQAPLEDNAQAFGQDEEQSDDVGSADESQEIES